MTEFLDCVEINEQIAEIETSYNSNNEISDVDVTNEDNMKSIEIALAAKEEGNDYFKSKDYDNAIESFSKAISYCPESDEHKDILATFYGNRAAAYVSLEEYEPAVEDCTEALELKPIYYKVLVRRMQAYEKLDKVEEALTDAKAVKEMEPTHPKINDIITRLQKQHDEKMSKMKDEALSKLKDLGNSILGNFGMSLDNFKMAQDLATGSWSVSMNK